MNSIMLLQPKTPLAILFMFRHRTWNSGSLLLIPHHSTHHRSCPVKLPLSLNTIGRRRMNWVVYIQLQCLQRKCLIVCWWLYVLLAFIILLLHNTVLPLGPIQHSIHVTGVVSYTLPFILHSIWTPCYTLFFSPITSLSLSLSSRMLSFCPSIFNCYFCITFSSLSTSVHVREATCCVYVCVCVKILTLILLCPWSALDVTWRGA